ncbi:hypothetical protein MCBB_PMCBBP0010 (plasmid) [Methanobacterium congolense]|uniref:Uncharacterized protein n=1 Tax=Methanobacterium congolense TaxID=118062 RepID=A0A1D3L5Y8_9EURY|nr:hypothetical protein MCBB_PMCBBP0010 [Methanobacterium congolense]
MHKGVLLLDKEKMKLIFNFDEPQQVNSLEDDVIFAVFDSLELAVSNFGKETVLQALNGVEVPTSLELPEKLQVVEQMEALPGYQ